MYVACSEVVKTKFRVNTKVASMNSTFTFTVNGLSHAVSTDSERSLLEVLREDLQLTGAKYGCGEGQCRACTVLMNGKSIASCITDVADADKQSILTIEGLAS